MGILNFFGKKNDYEPADIFLRLRNQIFSLTRNEISSLLEPSSPLISVVMESGYKDAVVTLVAVGDGTVSLYFSNGGGMIGLGQYEPVRNASLDLLSFANRFLSKAQPTRDYPLPSRGYTNFYFITSKGTFYSRAKEDDLGNNRHPFSPLFLKGHAVISQARLVEEKRKKDFQELMHAVTTGDQGKVSTLLPILPDPDISDPTGLTPLMAAAHSGQDRIVKQLLDRKATIDKKDSDGYTALMFACNAGQLACVQVLLEHGAHVNATDNDNSTPIMFAAQHGYNDIVKYLLGRGADPAFVGKHGLSAVGFAKQNNLVETEKILLGQR
jgi:hypothetical protein